MDKFFQKWQWKWSDNESTKEILYLFENQQNLVLEVKEKTTKGEKNCQWIYFSKSTQKIEPLQFMSMSENKRQFVGEISLQWDKKQAIMTREDKKEVFEVKIAKS